MHESERQRFDSSLGDDHQNLSRRDVRADDAGASNSRQNRASQGADLADTLDALSGGIALLAPDLTVVALNKTLAGYLGVNAQGAVGQLFTSILPDGAGAPEADLIVSTARDGITRSWCSLIERSALVLRVQRLRDSHIVVEADNAAGQSRAERRLGHMLEGVTDGLCVLDPRWRFTYWNRAAEHMTGVKAADVVGRNVAVAFGNMMGSQLASRFVETLRSKAPTEIHSWSYSGDLRGRAAGIYDAFIYPVEEGGAMVIFREVSERVLAERELTERREDAEALHQLVRAIAGVSDSSQLRQLLAEAARERCAGDGAAVVEVSGTSGHVTAAAGISVHMLDAVINVKGSLTATALGGNSAIVVTDYAVEYPGHHSHFPERVGPALAISLSAHDVNLGVLIVTRLAGSDQFSLREQERLRILADHAAIGLWKLRLLDQAHAANRAKSDFMAAMSHELRTPLTALTGYGEILAEQVAGPLSSVQLDVVERMRSVTRHLGTLINEVLTYSSLDAGEAEVALVPVDIRSVVSEATAVIEPLARRKGILFESTVPAVPDLVTDPARVCQILVHLLDNAIKFTERGSVRLDAQVTDSWLRLRVEDTGIGIAEENRDLLFRPFSQVDTGLRRRHEGAGLGLSISQRLAGLLGGSIEFQSSPGNGSAFTLCLPVVEPAIQS